MLKKREHWVLRLSRYFDRLAVRGEVFIALRGPLPVESAFQILPRPFPGVKASTSFFEESPFYLLTNDTSIAQTCNCEPLLSLAEIVFASDCNRFTT